MFDHNIFILHKTQIEPSLEIARSAYQVALDFKALQPIVLDLSKLSSLCSYMVIMSCHQKVQARIIATEIEKALSEKGHEPLRREGGKGSGWILLDYHDVFINVMHQPERDFYQLEEVWRKAKEIVFEDLPLV
ncbi:MAG: ribosome silencing factor [Candidatus Caenarcaniphilales bacterium]|nr:ribosome silencing factor [Candidatus Caenarcaniphilales bacterium]